MADHSFRDGEFSDEEPQAHHVGDPAPTDESSMPSTPADPEERPHSAGSESPSPTAGSGSWGRPFTCPDDPPQSDHHIPDPTQVSGSAEPVEPSESPGITSTAASVEGMAPGVDLAVLITAGQRADLSDREVVEHVKAWERLISWATAGQINMLMEFARRRGADPVAAPGAGGNGNMDVDEFAADEIALALTLSPVTAQRRLGLAVTTSQRLPAALDALAEGRIDVARLNTIHDETEDLSDDEAAALAREILDNHDRKPLTNGQMRHRLRKRATRARSKNEDEKTRRKAATDRHGVDLLDLGDGNAELRACLGSGDGATAMAILNSAAQQSLTPGDSRTIGQRRTAALIDLITGRTCAHHNHSSSPDSDGGGTQGDPKNPNRHGGRTRCARGGADGARTTADDDSRRSTDSDTATDGDSCTGCDRAGAVARTRGTAPGDGPPTRTLVNVTIAYSEFLRLADHFGLSLLGRTLGDRGNVPGEIEGLGTVPAWVVRDLVGDVLTSPGTGFRAVVYDDATGELKGLSSTRYVPPKAMAEHVRHHDVTCRFPGCRRAARRCDIDHARPWHRGGETRACNLQCLCRHHHRLKQNPAWRVRYRNGVSQWTAPTGHTYSSWPYDWRDPAPPDEFDDEPPVQEPPPDSEPRFRRARLTLQEEIALAKVAEQHRRIPPPPQQEPPPDDDDPHPT
jgi:Domain of unknown function (DUF222)